MPRGFTDKTGKYKHLYKDLVREEPEEPKESKETIFPKNNPTGFTDKTGKYEHLYKDIETTKVKRLTEDIEQKESYDDFQKGVIDSATNLTKSIQLPKTTKISEADFNTLDKLIYPQARALSALIEKPTFATAEFALEGAKAFYEATPLGMLQKYMDSAGNVPDWIRPVFKIEKKFSDNIKNIFDKQLKIASNPEKYGIVTPTATKLQKEKQIEAHSKGFLSGIANDVTEATVDIAALLSHFAIGKMIAPNFFKTLPSIGKEIGRRATAIGLHGLVTTSGTMKERLKAATWRIAYSLTPYAVNATGATGLSAVGLDFALNSALSSKSYVDAYNKAGGPNKEFVRMVIPNFIQDLGFASMTLGLPQNKLRKQIIKYQKSRSKAVHMTKEELQKHIKEVQSILPGKHDVREMVNPLAKVNFKALNKVMGYFDIDSKFRAMEAPKTGYHTKEYFSEISYHQDYGFEKILRPLVKDKKITYDDGITITRTLSSLKQFKALSKETKKRIIPHYKRIKNYLAKSKRDLKKEKVIQKGFVENTKESLLKENQEITKQLNKKKLTPKRKKVLSEKIDENKTFLDFIKDTKLQFVPIPYRQWFQKMGKGNIKGMSKVINQYYKHRKTVDFDSFLDKLLDDGVIQKKDLHIGKIMGDYIVQKGEKMALAKILNSAKTEGLVKPERSAPKDYSWADPFTFPGLKNQRIQPAFRDYLLKNFIQEKGKGKYLSKGLTYFKMHQFWNPPFLWTHDLGQAAWAGSLLNPKMPKYLSKAIKSVVTKDQDYYDNLRYGSYSKPFKASYDSFLDRIDRLFTEDKGFKFTLKNLNPIHYIDQIYKAGHHTAWFGDQIIRTMTNNYYKEKGFTTKEAAEKTGLIHGEYNMLPPATKNALNRIWFTPSFKIAMTKQQLMEAKAIGETVSKGLTLKRAGKGTEALAAAGARILAMQYGRKVLFEHLGFREEDYATRYVKDIVNENGEEKELVIYTATPDNILMRYWGKLKRFPLTEDAMEKGLKAFPFTLHPLWDWSRRMLLTHHDIAGNPIYHKYDDPKQILGDALNYTTRKLYGISNLILEDPNEKERQQAMKKFEEEIGTAGKLMRYYFFPYVRGEKGKYLKYRQYKLFKSFKSLERKKPSTGERREIRIRNFKNELEKLQAEIDEEEKRRGEQSGKATKSNK